MPGGIYLINQDQSLTEMAEEAYDSERILQELLEQYPNLLAGDQMNETEPRRWLLVRREVPVPDSDSSGGRWSVDHLFLDQDGIPTLVEVKRSSDTRIRREVVGQMLDYAANAVVYWSVEKSQSELERQQGGGDLESNPVLLDFLGPDDVQEDFWEKVKTNLQAGRVRLVFVSDVIPTELKQIVEFLNGQMDPAEVLAVEIRQYQGGGQTALVPRVIGQTAEAEKKKRSVKRVGKQWDWNQFITDMQERGLSAEIPIAKRILDWGTEKNLGIWWGKGSKDGGFVLSIRHNGENHSLFEIWSYGVLETYFQWYAGKPPFESEEKRIELLKKFNSIPGVNLPRNSITRRPTIPLSLFSDDRKFDQLIEVLEGMIAKIRET